MAADRVTATISAYQRQLAGMPFFPATTYGRATFGAEGVAKKLFLTFLFANTDISIRFLKDVGLLRGAMVCYKCCSQMPWCVDANRKDGFRW
jgi:hypothetical protein